MGDDGVGIHVLRMLKERLASRSDLEFKELSVGGLRLVEEMLGHHSVFLIDSMEAPPSEIGSVKELSVEDFKVAERPPSPHVTDFATALDLYKRVRPADVPRSIRIFTVGIAPTWTFTEGLSQRVQDGALELTDRIAAELGRS